MLTFDRAAPAVVERVLISPIIHANSKRNVIVDLRELRYVHELGNFRYIYANSRLFHAR